MSPPGLENAKKPKLKRRRPARSCQECRRRKIKCDLKEPCSHCISSKSQCFYNVNRLTQGTGPRPLAGGHPSSSLNSSEPAFHPSPDTGRSVAAKFNDSRPADTGPSLPDRECELEVLRLQIRALAEAIPSTSDATANRSVQDPIHRIRRPGEHEDVAAGAGLLVQRHRRCVPPRGQIYDVEQESPLPQSQPLMTLNKSRLYGTSHWTHGGFELQGVAALMKGDTDAAVTSAQVQVLKARRLEIRRLLHGCKVLARDMKASRPSRTLSWPPDPGFCTALDGSIVDPMVHQYVSNFESVFRILHIPSFWIEYEQYCKSPQETSIAVRFKIQLVIAIGSSLCKDRSGTDMLRLTSSRWIHAAQSWAAGPMEKDRLSLSGLQVQCLLILARQVLSISGDLIWIAVGTLIRTAMQMGLHRDPKHFANITIFYAEMRRRLWATVLEMNLQASLDSGTPLAMSCDDYDTESPASVNDEDMNEGTTVIPQYPKGTLTDTSVQRLLLKYTSLRMRIIRNINSFDHSAFSEDEVLSITSELNDACQECAAHLPPNIQGNNGSGGGEPTIFKHNLADLLLRRFLLALHRPLVSSARIGHLTSHFSRKFCLDAATALLSPPPNANFDHLVLLGGGIFKNRIIHASLAISSELLIELNEHEHMMQWPSVYRRMLIDALRGALGQIAGRISLGETNVRLHSKLSVVLCMSECTQTGFDLQLRMLYAAEESLKTSYAAIQARASGMADLGGARRDIVQGQEGLDDPTFQDFAQEDFDFSDFGFSDFGPELDNLLGLTDSGVDGN